MTTIPSTEPEISLITPERHGQMLEALGLLTTRWGYVESMVEDLIAGFLEIDPQLLFPITADIPIGTRLKHLRLLGKLRLNDYNYDVLNLLITQAEDLLKHRNLLIHSLWASLADDPEIAELLTTRPGRSGKLKQINLYCNYEYLKWLVSAISRCAFLFHDFGKQFNFFNGYEKLSAEV